MLRSPLPARSPILRPARKPYQFGRDSLSAAALIACGSPHSRALVADLERLMTMWGWLAALLIDVGVICIATQWNKTPEGIGAPTPVTLIGIAAIIAGVGLGICEAVVAFYQIGRR